MENLKELTINEAIYDLPNGKKGKIAVFMYLGGSDPAQILDHAISIYVGNNGYHKLIDANLDNPWMRVIISDINGMHQEIFDFNRHRLINNLKN